MAAISAETLGAVASHNAQQSEFVERRHANTRKIDHLIEEQGGYLGHMKRGISMHRIASVLALWFALAAQTAHAFIDPPWITPEAPHAGDMVSVNIRMGICDAVFEYSGYPQITQNGNAIRVLEYGDHVTFNDFCIYDIGTTVDPIGVLPPGDYTLTVDFYYLDFAFGATIMNLGVIPFTVTGAAPVVPVPSSDRRGLLVLSLLVLVISVGALRRRQRSPC